MRYLKHFLRLLRYAFLAVLALAFGAIIVLTMTERGRDNLAGLISDFISTPEQSVRLRGIDGIWTGELTLDSLAIGDKEGTWLVGRGVAVDWSPLALFSMTFRAERIFAERIEVARLPKGAEKKADDAAFSLPVSLSLKQIDLPDIAIGPELAGGVAAVAAKGSLRADATPLEIEAELNVARSDGGAGSIDASVHFVPDENRIDIDVNGSEPQGGIIANLLQLPDAPPVEIHISGEGPLANWQGSGTFAVDGTVITRVEGRHQLTDKGSAIEAKGDGEFQRFVPEKLRPLLSGKTVFDIAGTATKAGGVIVERATVESNALRGSASGSIDPEGASDFALEAAATGDGVLLSFGSEESPIDMVVKSATVRALGAGNEPNLDISAVMGRVSTNSAAIDNLSVTLHSDAFNIAARTGPVTGQATAAALTIDNPTIAPLVAGKISAGFAGTLKTDALTVTEGSLSSDALNGAFGGEVSLANGAIRLDIEADVASVALPAAVRPALAERVELSARFLRDTEGHVSADPFSLTSGALEAKGTIRSADEKIDATINGTLSDIGLVAKEASGAVEIALKAEGALSKPDVSVTVTSDSIMAAGHEIAGLRLEAS
ncbi:MAG: translocation/assembly module TamB, partial [Alphaproteobacteria bacterium]|nr:translocation/assembly module TamB [Alphaproteobacteria bacterium]